MFTSRHTLLLISRQVLARIDYVGSKRLRVDHLWVTESNGGSMVGDVARAMQLGSRTGRKVTIVSPELWIGTVALPNDVASLVSANELEQALALEAEMESGISAFDAVTRCVKLPSQEIAEPQWLVAQMANSQLSELKRSVQEFRSTLLAVTHPLSAELTTALQSGSTIDDLLNEISYEHFLTDESSFADFANRWAVHVAAREEDRPLWMQVDRGGLAFSPRAMAASLAIAAAGACGLAHWASASALRSATDSISRVEKQLSELDEKNESLKAVEATIAQKQSVLTKSRAVRESLERKLQQATQSQSLQNTRWASLLDGLAQSANASCWVRRIESKADCASVYGLALHHAAANQFASDLERTLNEMGWSIAPATATLTEEGLVQFEIRLQASDRTESLGGRTKFVSRKQAIDPPATNETAQGDSP